MASPAPVWRVKTRPCPFYQQGRCLFEESCNFMHNVNVKNSTVSMVVSTPSKGHFPNPPVVVVDSPQPIRSPTLSPRMSDLLHALRDVIGDEPEEGDMSLVNDSYVSEESNPTEVSSVHFCDGETSVGDSGDPAIAAVNMTTADEPTFCSPPAVPSSGNNSSDTEHSHSPVSPTEPTTELSDLLSPVDLTQLNLTAFTYLDHTPSSKDGDSIDSGYADTWTTPRPFVKSPPSSPVNSTFVLSSPFGVPTPRSLSPKLGTFISQPPASPFGTLPSALHDPPDLNLDPLESESIGAVRSPPSSPGPFETKGYLIADGRAEGDPEEDREDISDPEPSSRWNNSEDEPSVINLGMLQVTPKEVNDAILHSSVTPTHFLAEPVDFVDDEADVTLSAVSRSPSPTPSKERNLRERTDEPLAYLDPPKPTGEDLDFTDSLPSFDAGDADLDREHALSDGNTTAQLAYLSSPVAPVNENDTLNSIYNDYTAPSNELDTATVVRLHTDMKISSSLETSDQPLPDQTPADYEPIRKQVFTPPLVQRGSRTITAESSTSLPSPKIFSDAARASRLSFHSPATQSIWSPDSSVSELQELPQSKKVPFGFRHSRLVDHLRNSSRNSLPTQRPPALVGIRTSSSQSDRAFSPNTPAPYGGGLRPLRLQSILGPVPSSAPSANSHFSFASNHQSRNINRLSMSSTTVSSESSISRNPLLFSARSSPITKHIRNSLLPSRNVSTLLSSHQLNNLSELSEPRSAPISSSSQWHTPSAVPDNLTRPIHNGHEPLSGFSEPSFVQEDDDEDNEDNGEDIGYDHYDHTIRRPLPTVPHTAPITRTNSICRPPMYAIATPPPTLMFAIASDDVNQVRRVLENGEAGPNDLVGPQSALTFTLTNDQLTHKIDIVKTLLAYGADPTVLKKERLMQPPAQDDNTTVLPSNPLTNVMDPATRYYVERADASSTRRTSALIHRSFFRPLTRVQYELIGQDRALEQLFRVLSVHSRQLSVTPIVVLLCGPSGHGKSLLARKFGSLLDVPTHTVNMTVLNSTQDLWRSYSMSPHETLTTCTLAEFLINNEGKRCVVVLDEIEKTHDEKTLWSLLMPWELGRCAFEANGRHVDVRNVVWLGTSNIGHDLVFEHHEARAQPDEVMPREEYVALMGLLRPRVSKGLGASILSRVTTVLPFVPFTSEEKRAICFEALHGIAGEVIKTLPTDVIDSMVSGALGSYISTEGARSLYRAISNQLVDNI